jgi:hypothetical protein
MIMRKIVLLLSVLVAVVGGSGCWNPFSPPLAPVGGDTAWAPQERLLQDLVNAYNQRDIEAYMLCLAPDFIFQFALVDSAELRSRGINQPYWGRTDEEIATRNLFDNAERIELTIYAGDWDRAPQDTTGTLFKTRRPYHLWYRGYLPDEGVTGEMDADGYATFQVQEREGRWQIVRWIDEKLSG